MNLKSLVEKNRSYRRFDASVRLKTETLSELVDLARLSASARNQQSLKYIISTDDQQNAAIFECLGWAGYLKDWKGPAEGERPTGYIIVMNDASITTNHFCDEGIAAQSILLGAAEKGLGGCIIATINRPKIRPLLLLPDELDILLVIALGSPVEQVVIEEMQDGEFKYWRDTDSVHHVPKRSLDEIIYKKY